MATRGSRFFRTKTLVVAATAVGAGALVWLVGASPAGAQIKRPGSHPKYSVELEPHLLFHHAGYGWYGDDDGWGPGVRLSIPIIEDGPIKKINNSMAIGFGLDWAHFSGNCWGYYWGRPRPDPRDPNYYYWGQDCSANEIWAPVVLQWNFFLTELISVFGEPGLAIVRRSWEYYAPCPAGWCKDTDSDTDLKPLVMFAGVRFHFSDSIGLTLRLGWPYVSAGASFFF